MCGMRDVDYKQNVYILGAGFSKPAGGPLMNEFFDAMQDVRYRGKLSEEDKACLDSALAFRQEMAKASDNFAVNLDNLEDLFGLLEVKVTAGEKTEEDRRRFILAVLRTLELRIKDAGDPPTKETEHKSKHVEANRALLTNGFGVQNLEWLYHAFSSMVARTHEGDGPKDSIITFNYDLIVDRALCELGYGADYALREPDHTRDFSTVWRTQKASVPLFKLHGSANWFRCRHHDKIYVAPPRRAPGGEPASLLHLSLDACPKCTGSGGKPCPDATEHTPLIVPPTWNKAAYQGGLQSVWTAALKALETAGRIIVIGFSLPDTDLFFRFLLTAGVQVGKGVELYLVDPSERVAQRYEQFLSPYFKQNRFFWVSKPSESLQWEGTFNSMGLRLVALKARREA